jgi:three-Cys-motif partner protein
MSTKNLFREPFDDGTHFKLKIFDDYFKSWLQVFISPKRIIWKEIQIFDLFAGMGKDQDGSFGSPLLIISELNKFKTLIKEQDLKINIVLNEYSVEHFDSLVENVNTIADTSIYSISFSKEDFKDVFDRYYDSMLNTVNFIFLDQNGIKQITESVFKRIINLKQTDFIFFISSSFIKRFSESPSFSKYLTIEKQDLENQSYYHIHRIVLKYYRSLIPSTTEYFLAPFSIKKPSGIYGLIFGSNHIYGQEKFLKVCWKHDSLTGEANYDIDNEKIRVESPFLFSEYNIPKKIQLFESELRDMILKGVLNTDFSVYSYTLKEGFLPKQANVVLKKLVEEKKITFKFKLINEKVHRISPLEINLLT